MKLYHGSNMEIEEVDLSKCRPFKDFGCGFYLTTIEEQAVKMARRVSRIYGKDPCVSIFEFDEEAAFKDDTLHVRLFKRPTKEWALFVINNRNREVSLTYDTESNRDLKYDLVIGPIANDDLALLFRQFSNGLIGVDTLVKEMKFKKLIWLRRCTVFIYLKRMRSFWTRRLAYT